MTLNPSELVREANGLSAPARREILHNLVQVASSAANVQLDAMSIRLTNALFTYAEQNSASKDASLSLDAAHLLKQNTYAFYYLASGRIEAALRQEVRIAENRSDLEKPEKSDAAWSLVPYAEMDTKVLLANISRPIEVANGDQLAALVTGQIIPNGANYVTVLNLPDASKTPDALAQSAAVQAWLSAMATTFNGHLAAGLAGQSKVLLVDAYTFDRDQAINPAPYGFSNVMTPACADVDANNPSSPAKNVLHSSLVCNKNTLIAGADPYYKFADSVHPTPFTNLLLARYVSKEMLTRGWL